MNFVIYRSFKDSSRPSQSAIDLIYNYDFVSHRFNSLGKGDKENGQFSKWKIQKEPRI